MCFREKIVIAELSEHVEVIINFHGVNVTLYTITSIQKRLGFSIIINVFHSGNLTLHSNNDKIQPE